MANFCSHCGAASKPGANFCEQCGARLAPDVDQPQPAVVPEQDNPYRRSNASQDNFGAGTGGGQGTVDGAGASGAGYTVNAGGAYDPFPESGIIQQLFTTRGRLNRWRYFKRCWAIWGLSLFIFILCGMLFGMDHILAGGLTFLGAVIGAVLANICLVIRRFHDMEPADSTGESFMNIRMGLYVGAILASGFWEWAGLLSALMSLYLMFNPGVPGANRHGADPLAK